MSLANIVNAPRYANDFRSAMKAEYHASLKSMEGFWAVVESTTGLFVGRVESWNPDHGDIILNSVERIDVKVTCDKVWIRGSQVKMLYMVSKNSKEQAVTVARKVLIRKGEEL